MNERMSTRGSSRVDPSALTTQIRPSWAATNSRPVPSSGAAIARGPPASFAKGWRDTENAGDPIGRGAGAAVGVGAVVAMGTDVGVLLGPGAGDAPDAAAVGPGDGAAGV